MERRDVFDVTKEPARDLDRYGTHDFGRHCLLARRLLESGVTFVKVTHSNYDTHNENFDFHLEQVGEFDQSFSALLDDLAQRGRLEHTLVIVMSEFGRTPRINHLYGRDHWSAAWSVALAGAGNQAGHRPGQDQRQRHGRRRRPGPLRALVPHVPAGRRARPVRDRSRPTAARSRSPTRPPRPSRNCWHDGHAGKDARRQGIRPQEPADRMPVRRARPVRLRQCRGPHGPRWDLATGKQLHARRSRELGVRAGVSSRRQTRS